MPVATDASARDFLREPTRSPSPVVRWALAGGVGGAFGGGSFWIPVRSRLRVRRYRLERCCPRSVRAPEPALREGSRHNPFIRREPRVSSRREAHAYAGMGDAGQALTPLPGVVLGRISLALRRAERYWRPWLTRAHTSCAAPRAKNRVFGTVRPRARPAADRMGVVRDVGRLCPCALPSGMR
jgi:hypothetical protein